jgi:hemolysin III
LVYALKWPDPYPPQFGFHEIWHLFVLAGAGAHFAFMVTLLPMPIPGF